MVASRALPSQAVIAWQKMYRIIPSRYPPVDLFERIGDPADWETLAAIESMTNPLLRSELGEIAFVAASERISGPGTSPIMAAFTHIGFPSRFSDGSFGVYYASDRFEGALHEVAYHNGNFLRSTNEPRTRLELRTYVGSLNSSMHDVRGLWPDVHDHDSYVASQALAVKLRSAGSNGIVFDGVRLPGCSNIAVFRPRALASKTAKPHLAQDAHLFLEWDGAKMARYLVTPETVWRSLSSAGSGPAPHA